MAVVFSNNATTALASSVTSSATSITVQDGSVFPTLSGSDYTYITLEDLAGNVEIVKLTARSVNVLTIVRAQDGTSARAFGIASKCELRLTAALLNEVAAQADTDTNTTYTAGSGLALTGTVFSNTSPDRTVALTGAGATSISGTYPNFTITSTDTNTVYTHPSSHPISFITGLQAALDGKVDDSQVLTNVPAGALFTDTVYTLPFADNSTNWNTAYGWGNHASQSYATQSYVGTAISNLVDSSPATLDTLNELAAALGDDPNFATTVSNSIGTKWTQDNTKISNWDTAYGWGNHASAGYFLASNYTNVFKSGSEIAGSQDLNNYRTTGYYAQDSNADATSGSNYPINAAGILEVITGDQGNGLQTEQRYSQYNTNDKYVRHYYNGTWTAWAEQWNSSSDGAGSGLDADLLDGQQGSYYAPNSSLGNYLPLTGGTLTGTLKVTSGWVNVSSNVGGSTPSDVVGLHVGWNKSNGGREVNMVFNGGAGLDTAEMIFSGHDGTTYSDIFQIDGTGGVRVLSGDFKIGTTTVIDSSRNLSAVAVTISDDIVHLDAGGTTRLLYDRSQNLLGNEGTNAKAYNVNATNSFQLNGTTVIDSSRNLTNIGTLNGGTPWHSANDGSGSGLDADLLDGQHGSYYAPNSSLGSYLPLAGGTLTGDLVFSGSRAIQSTFFDLDFYTNGTVPLDVGRLELKSGGKTGWAPGDEHGAIEWYVADGSGVGARTAARIVSVNNQGNGVSTTTFEGDLAFYTSAYNAFVNSSPALLLGGDNTATFVNNVNINTGALQLGGTTVIDSSRNLTNIGTISSTFFTTTSGGVVSISRDGSSYAGGMLRGALEIGSTARSYRYTSGWSGSMQSGILANTSEDWEFMVHDAGDALGSIFCYESATSAAGIIRFGRNVGYGVSNAIFDGTINSGAITSNGNLTIKGAAGFNATGETASIYLGDTASEIRATYGGGTKFFVNGTDRMEIEGGSGNLNLKTGNLEINNTTVIDSSRNLTNIGTGSFSGTVTAPTFSGALSGNASTASTWATSRTITLGGDLSGSVSINGGSNVTLSAQVADNSHNHDWVTSQGLNNTYDLDNITSDGSYRWTGSAPINNPSGTYHNMFVQSDGGQPIQLVWGGSGDSSQDLHIRRRDSGVWRAWTTFWNDGNFATGSDTRNFGALQINGTTVIDSSRNLTNIGTLNGGTPWTSANDGSGSGLDADLLDGINSVDLFNNMGQGHTTRTSFDATTASYNFGWRFIQGSTNGPSTNASQYYSQYVGLGTDYPATGSGSYGMYVAYDRDVINPYISIRYNQNNSLSAWSKISAGKADSLTTARTINGVSFDGTSNITVADSTKLPLTGGTLTGGLTGTTAAFDSIYLNSNDRIYGGTSYRALEANPTGTQLQLGEGYGLINMFKTQNAVSELMLWNNRQDAGNIGVSKVSGYNGVEVANMTFYRGGGGASGFVRFQVKPTNADVLADQFQIGDGNTSGYGVNVPIGGYRIGGTIVINSSRQLRSINAIYNTSDTQIMDLGNTTYTILKDPEGSVRMYLGDTGDAGNYYDNSAHTFRNRAAAVQVQISDGGVNLQNTSATYKVQGTTVIDASRNIVAAQITTSTDDIGTGENNGLRLINTNPTTGTTWHMTAGTAGVDNYTFTLRNGATDVNAMRVSTSGSTTFASSISAPIFYDSDNTGYYVDPSGNSSLNTFSSTYLSTSANVNGSGVGGAFVNGRIGFDQTGTRSWTIGAASGLLNIYSGDGNGGLNLNNNISLLLNGTTVIDSNRNLTNVNLVKFREQDASFYISPTNTNTLNAQYGSAADTADMWINYRGYQDGQAYFRDFRIGDGKGNALLFVDGSAKAFDFQNGSFLQIAGTTVIDSSRVMSPTTVNISSSSATTKSLTVLSSHITNAATIVVGNTVVDQTLVDSNTRPMVVIDGKYPVLNLNHTVTGNDNHGPNIQFTHDGYNSNRQVVIGTDGQGQRLDFGFSGGTAGANSDKNPHNGISGYSGVTPMRLFQNGLLLGSTGVYPNEITSVSHALDVRGTGTATDDWRAPIFYDSNNTGFYVDPAGTSIVYELGSKNLGVNTGGSSTTKYGLSLYSGAATNPVYGIMFTGTAGSGTHGAVNADWATYFTMNSTAGRGWIFRDNSTPTNVASISNQGHASFNGSVLVGGTGGDAYNTLSAGQLYFSDNDISDYLAYSIGLKRKEDINGNYTKLNIDWHTGITLGASPTYGGIRFFDNSIGHYNSTNKLFSVGEGDNRVRVYDSISAPIFYDSNDTAYYVDPNGNSSLNTFSSTGLTISGSRPFTYDAGGGSAIIQASTGGWGMAYAFKGSSGTYRGGYGVLGSNDALTSYWIGAAYNSYYTYIDSDQMSHSTSVRAPIFYDSNNTGYYVNPYGTSNLDNNSSASPTLTVTKTGGGNGIGSLFQNWSGDNSWGCVSEFRIANAVGTDRPSILFSTAYNSNTWSVGYGYTDDNFRINMDHGHRNGGWGTTALLIDRSSNVTASGSSRAPIFYDSNNTGYYVDPNGTSNFGGRIQVGTFANSQSNNGEAWIGRATDRAQGTLTVQLGTGSGRRFEVVDTDWTTVEFSADDSGNATAASSMRAPIFYDSNDTSYYTDPASTSNLNILTTAGDITAGGRVYIQGSTTNYLAQGPYSATNLGIVFGNALFLYAGTTQLVSFGTSTSNFTNQIVADKSAATTDTASATIISKGSVTTTTGYNPQNFHITFQNGAAVTKGSISSSHYATIYSTSSDYRLKEDLQPISNATERLLALNPVNFKWIDGQERSDGFIAHELQEHLPEAVTGEKDATTEVTETVVAADGTETEVTTTVPEMQGIDQSKLVPLLVKTIQELEARITALENA
jgi:hypothetical protein